MPQTTFAIGDVHGCLNHVVAATAWAAEDAAARGVRGLVVFLGDYVDRGPDAAGTIDFLMAGPREDHIRWIALRGNHDDMLARVWRDPGDELAGQWWEHGGQQTLASYGWHPLNNPVPRHLGEWIPRRHAEFLSSLPLVHEDEDRIFVHAGLRPGVALAEQSERDMMWIRGGAADGYEGRTIVHGHTPQKRNPYVSAGRVNLDMGCFASGILACAAFEPGDPMPRIRTFGRNGSAEATSNPVPR